MGSRKPFTHLDEKGAAKMVDIAEKAPTLRHAIASGSVRMNPETIKALKDKKVPKGDVLSISRIAGIMAAKRTAELIPLCHPLTIDFCDVQFSLSTTEVGIRSEVRVFGTTGVEMEALTAASVAALTIYDMCKSLDRTMVIGEIVLLEKHGGRSGTFLR